MSSFRSGPEPQPRPPGVYSTDCIDVFHDGPGDGTVRPCPPELLEQARAARAALIRDGKIKPPPGSEMSPHGEGGSSAADVEATAQPTPVPEAANGVLRVQLDASLILRLRGLDHPVELIDENGRVVARVTPLAPAER